MEAFGRVIAVICAAVGMVLMTIFAKTVPAVQQKNETVRSLAAEYVEDLMEERRIVPERKARLLKELAAFGEYEVELTVYERRRYENETGRVYLYAEWEEEGLEKELISGSFLRVEVSEERKGKAEVFLYREGSTVVLGGRVP